jgi:hypothetical protein
VTVFAARERFYGLAADTKPTEGMNQGSLFVEVDTGSQFVWTGTEWAELEFSSGGGGAVAWGDITGTLADQLDLQAALDAADGTPGGADTQVQFNNAGAFGGDAGFTYDATTDSFTLAGVATMGSIASGAIDATGDVTLTSAAPRILLNESDQLSDEKLWDITATTKVWSLRTRTDADGVGVNAVTCTRATGTALATAPAWSFSNGISVDHITVAGGGTAPTQGIYSSAASTLALRTSGSNQFVISASAATFTPPVTAPRFTVNGSTVPANGIYLPGTNRLAFSSNTARRAEFDANGNFITLQATADQSYSLQTPSTGFSITIANNITTLILNPAGTLATGTITMPATPIDGQVVRFTTSQIITALTVSPNSGQSIVGAPTTLALGQGAAFIYNLSGTTWYRLYLGN